MNDLIVRKLAYLKDSRVKEAMLYSLLAGGKRLRPRLLYAAVKGFGKEIIDLDNFAVALEMIHTYSLIHDDLPAMDNDDLRRGKNTCHIEYDEATAILAGDALLTEAFNLMSKAAVKSDKLVKCINILASSSGANGMIYGQEADMFVNGANTFEYLKTVHHHKTGMLITAPLKMACVLCDREELTNVFEKIGFDIGLAFQIQDDILDVTSCKEELGKTSSDILNDKLTGVNVLGLDNAVTYMQSLYEESIAALKRVDGFNGEYLVDLILKMANRKN